MGVAVVTGSSRGIGAATARLLASRGWDLCVTYQTRRADAEDVVGSCVSLGSRAIACQADVAAEADVVKLFSLVDTELGPIGALVNNAGIVAPKARVDQLDGDRLQRMFAVNVIGPFLCCREAIRRMSTHHGGKGGSIVNVSSVAARIGSPGEYVDYAASKGALDTMTVGLAKELATENIRVNAVRAGIVATDIHASGGQPDRIQRLRGAIPMRREGQAVEIANAVVWLCSPEASYVTGALLDVSGGR